MSWHMKHFITFGTVLEIEIYRFMSLFDLGYRMIPL
jgi:hypothetical protein